MKHLLKEGVLTKYVAPPGEGGGLSGEVHIIKHHTGTYIVRRCSTLEKALFYEYLAKKFEKYGFLPKLLARHNKDVFYEYISGRNVLNKKDALRVAYDIGKIAAYINTVPARGTINARFYKQVRELTEGKFIIDNKVRAANKRAGLSSKTRITPIFTRAEAVRVRTAYRALKKKVKPTLALDMNDTQSANFRITPEGKIYFVDIEAIKPRVKGFSIAKGFQQWFKTKETQRRFLKGYASVLPTKFFTKEYKDFLYLSFFVQMINYRWKLREWKIGVEKYEMNMKKLWEIVNKYDPM